MKSDGPAPTKSSDQEDKIEKSQKKKKREEKKARFDRRKPRFLGERNDDGMMLDLSNRLPLGLKEEGRCIA